MFTLAHLSDVHLSPLPVPKLRQLCSKRLLGFLNWHVLGRKRQHQSSALDTLIAHMKTQDYGHVALTGDLINIALPQEFETARQWLEALGSPENISVVPGNHDAYIAIDLPGGVGTWAPYMQSDSMSKTRPTGKTWADGLSEGLWAGFPYVRKIAGLAIIGVKSGVPTRSFSAAGELGEQQRDALAGLLKRLPEADLFRVLLIHHPPLPRLAVPMRDLSDAGQLAAILRDHRVDLALHGHTHLSTVNWGQGPNAPYPVIGVPSASMGLAGHRPLARYNLYDISEGAEGWNVRLRGFGARAPGGAVTLLEDTQLVPPADFPGEM